jgi:hypothetical protein
MVLLVNLRPSRPTSTATALRIGASTVSSGKQGKETPTGVFTILQKNAKHRKSNLYNNAPMPYMQRLTWDGIALHAGNLPGYPASHGCVRLPMAFAWTAYPLLGQSAGNASPDLLATPSLPLALPPSFATQLYKALVPGTTLLVTSLPAVRPVADEQNLQPVLESDAGGSTL